MKLVRLYFIPVKRILDLYQVLKFDCHRLFSRFDKKFPVNLLLLYYNNCLIITKMYLLTLYYTIIISNYYDIYLIIKNLGFLLKCTKFLYFLSLGILFSKVFQIGEL